MLPGRNGRGHSDNLYESSWSCLNQTNDVLSRVHKVHFVGIGGAGMCALAEILHHRGYALTGSDNNESDTLARVRALGIPVHLGHDASNVGDAELVVHTAAVHAENVELVEAKRRGIPVLERSVLLGLVAREFADTIAVAGTHGKTTTTSMAVQILLMGGLDPTAIIGGKLPLIGGNSRVGHTPLMVCEACEFVDTFLQLWPAVSVILNIDADHLDYFKTMENLIAHFGTFASQTSRAVVCNGDDANTMQAVWPQRGRVKLVTFGFGAGNNYSCANEGTGPEGFPAFDIVRNGETVAHIHLRVPGRHNILNALAATAAAMEVGATAADCERGLNAYTGAGRRFEILGEVNGVTVADDYAHHPAELEVTLRAAKSLRFREVWAVFQPFTFSRTVLLMDEFVRVLKIADHVVLSEIMGSREVNTWGVTSAQLAEKLPGSVVIPGFQDIADYIVNHAQPGDLVLTLGCGDIYKAAKKMLKTTSVKA